MTTSMQLAEGEQPCSAPEASNLAAKASNLAMLPLESLEHHAAEIGQRIGDEDQEASGAGAVDDAVIVTDADG